MSRSQLQNRNRRPGRRSTGTRPYRKLFVIIVEGETEKAYFDSALFKNTDVSIITRTSKKNHPGGLVEEMERRLEDLRNKGLLRSGDPAWIILDDDARPHEELLPVFDWAASRERQQDRGVGFSRPQFEYWLILHYEDGAGISTQAECMRRIDELSGGYRKGDSSRLPLEMDRIKMAINGAQARLSTPLLSIADIENQPSAFTSVHFLAAELTANLQ